MRRHERVGGWVKQRAEQTGDNSEHDQHFVSPRQPEADDRNGVACKPDGQQIATVESIGQQPADVAGDAVDEAIDRDDQRRLPNAAQAQVGDDQQVQRNEQRAAAHV